MIHDCDRLKQVDLEIGHNTDSAEGKQLPPKRI